MMSNIFDDDDDDDDHVVAPSLEVFKVKLDGTLSNLI